MNRRFEESDLIGESVAMRRLRDLVATIAPTRVPVLIEGPTGAGKELVAELLHHRSHRKGRLVAFNVCALGESMFEDALFGHVRGAYTGAIDESPGLLREAASGTAFFDEVSGLPLPMQAKLLRAVETGEFRPIGAKADAHSDFRLVAATNESLDRLVERGRFRADLKHRLSGVVIRVPALADRRGDIPALACHFARRAAGFEIAVEAAALDLLMAAAWPGNVRELKQVIDVAVALSGRAVTYESAAAALAHRTLTPAPLHDDLAERRELLGALEDASWNVDEAAATLGIHRATMYRWMKRYDVEVPKVALSRATGRHASATRATAALP